LQRQVDFLVATEHRLVNTELKTVDQSLQLIGGINGPWTQELPGGKHRSLERNFYRQAHDTTFAISDDMQQLARLGEVPRVSGKYYSQFDTQQRRAEHGVGRSARCAAACVSVQKRPDLRDGEGAAELTVHFRGADRDRLAGHRRPGGPAWS
jgi:hypothetical protein